MGESIGWIAIGIALFTALIQWLAYRRGTVRVELSYVVTTNAAIVPPQLAAELKLRHDGEVLLDPSLTVVRIVCTGDTAITAQDFETDLEVRLLGVNNIASAICSATRPADLRPKLDVAHDTIRVEGRLLNPGDMMELQVLSAGTAQAVELGGRITNAKFKRLPTLPYPPGVGPEGEMVGPIDHFMWWIFVPGAIVGLGGVLALSSDFDYSNMTRILIGIATIIALAVYVKRTQHLVRRRRMWAPPTDAETL